MKLLSPNFVSRKSLLRTALVYLVALSALVFCAAAALLVSLEPPARTDMPLSIRSFVQSFGGSSYQSKMQLALSGSMRDKATKEEKDSIVNWVTSGASEEQYLLTIAPIFEANCLSCHNGTLPRAPNLDTYDRVLKVSEIDNISRLSLANTQLSVNPLYLLGMVVSLGIILAIYSHQLRRRERSQLFPAVFLVLYLSIIIGFLSNGYPLSLSGYILFPGLIGFILLFIYSTFQCVLFFRAERQSDKTGSTSAGRPFNLRLSLKLKVLISATCGLIVVFVMGGYYALQYVRNYGICLGAKCHYTGEVDEFEKRYWQIESPTERAKLPVFKYLKALSTDQLTPSTLKETHSQFKTWEKIYGDSHGTKYSNLNQINKTNLSRLTMAWEYRSGGEKLNTLQASPIIVNGVIYSPTANGAYVALKANSGQEIWKFKPSSGAPAYRGMAWWQDPANKQERLFFIAGDSLHSLDAKTGTLNDGFGSNGKVQTGYSHPAPVTTDDLVVIATYNAKIVAYNIRTGAKSWTFETRKTDRTLHGGGGRYYHVGSNVWSGMALDKQNGLLFATVGNPRLPNYGALRPGANLYSNSVVALDIKTGKLKWHFQETAHDLWDMDISSPPVLTTIRRQDQNYDVVAATTKAGNTLLLDRKTGGLIYDFRLRRAPTSAVPGEHTAPYQPDLELPQPFSRMAFSLSDVTDIGDENRSSVMDQLKNTQMGFYAPPVLNSSIALFGMNGGASWPGAASNPHDGMLYIPSNRFPWLINLYYASVDESQFPASPEREIYQASCATCHGENRQGRYQETSYVPTLTGVSILNQESEFISKFTKAHPDFETGLGIQKSDISALYAHFNRYDRLIERDRKSGKKFLHSWRHLKDFQGYPGSNPPWGQLTALDLNTGRIKWQVPFGNYDEINTNGGEPTGQPNAGGAIVTAGGLIFATGTVDGKLRAFDIDDGSELWSYQLPFSGSAPPATYEIDGEQYLVVLATGRNGGYFKGLGDAMIAFKIQ